jgi:hypothetical protein
MINPLGHSHPSSYSLRSSSRPAQHETKRFLGWTVLLLFLLVPGGPASAQTTLTPATLSFGDHVVNVPSTAKTATLTNTQTVALTLSSIAIGGGTAPADYVWGGKCPLSPKTLGPGKSCEIPVVFTPSALGSRTATLTVTDNASNSPQTVALTGTGTSPLTASPASWAFFIRDVGSTSAAKTITLTSHLHTSLPVSTPVATGDFAVASNTCGASLGPLLTCTIGVTFTPTEAGARTGTLSIPYSAFGSPLVVALSGSGTGPISIIVTPGNASIFLPLGQTTQQFTATGYFKKGGPQNLTPWATWSSSAPGVATINAAGLASAVAIGQTTIEAALGALNGVTTFNVTRPSDNFVLTGSLNTAREEHTATLLNNGQVLIAGGIGLSGYSIAEAELYDPATGAFTPTGSLNTARSNHTATLLDNGMVLIAGGWNSTALASAELYNPATGTFTYTPGGMNSGRWGHTASFLNNGLVLIAGGSDSVTQLAGAELYNPATGTFILTGSLTTARDLHTATLLNNGMVLMAGGCCDSSGDNSLASAELYDPATGTFSNTTGSLNAARQYDAATLLNNGTVLIAGGVNYPTGYLTSAELYDPATGTFATTGSLNTARDKQTATLLNNSTVLIVGGFEGDGGDQTSAEIYNPTTGTFAYTSGSLSTARDSHTATLLSNGAVLIAGGTDSNGRIGILASAELYGPVTLTPPTLESIAVTPATSTLSPGATQQFIATGTFSDGSKEQLASVTWSSSNPAVAQISNDASNHGVGLAVAAGTVTITATDGSVSGTATLTVP